MLTVKGLDKVGIHIFPPLKPKPQVYQEFIQVDVVGLPDQLMKDLSKFDATEEVVEKPRAEETPKQVAEEDPMVLAEKAKVAEEQKKAAAAEKEKAQLAAKEKKQKMEREKALKKLQEEANREAALKALSRKEGAKGRAKIAGNLMSKGTSAVGSIGDARDRYVSIVGQKIKQHFNIFSWQRKKGLVAVVYIEIYPTGRVREKRILKRSIDPLFDSAVMQAVDDAQPLPIPEDASLMRQGITVEFRPEG